MPRVRGIGRRCPDSLPPSIPEQPMVAMIIRFIEELIDAFNFGNQLSK